MKHLIVGDLSFIGFNANEVVIEVETDNLKEAVKSFDKYFKYHKIQDFIYDGYTWPWLKEHPESASVMSTLNVRRYDSEETSKPAKEKLEEMWERPIKLEKDIETLKESEHAVSPPDTQEIKRQGLRAKKVSIEEFNEEIEIDLEDADPHEDLRIGSQSETLRKDELGNIWNSAPDISHAFETKKRYYNYKRTGQEKPNENQAVKVPGTNTFLLKSPHGHNIKIVRNS